MPQIAAFNKYLGAQLQGRLDPKVALDMDHLDSQASKNLQACDLFCHGIFGKYEHKDAEWHDMFVTKIAKDDYYLAK
jgi:hypothetical protein